MNENAVKNAIIDYLIYKGALVMRVNSGAFMGEYTDQKGRKRKRFGWFSKWFVLGDQPHTSGVPDIMAIFQDKLYCVETKAPGKKADVKPAQKQFLSEAAARGAITIVADSIDDVQKIIQ